MTTEDIILQIFCLVDDEMKDMPKHSQAKLYPSELVTIGILFALKGGYFRAFYRWLSRDYADLFAGLPDRTRLQRLLKAHQNWYEQLLAAPSFFTVIDSYPIELLFPIRQGRSPQQVGKKSKDKGRWSVGIRLGFLLNEQGQVVAWDWDTMSACVSKRRCRWSPSSAASSASIIASGPTSRLVWLRWWLCSMSCSRSFINCTLTPTLSK